MDNNEQIFPLYRLVAEYADGSRLQFDGFTEAQAQKAMEAAMEEHGDIAWWDGVTDLHYEKGRYHGSIPPPPHIDIILPPGT